MLKMDIFVKEASNPRFGDYQFELSRQISRLLANEHNIKEEPAEVAHKIVGKLKKIPLVEKVSKLY